MMTKSRIALLSLSALAGLTTMLAFAASFFAHPAIALAQTVPPIVTDPPSADANGLLALLLQAKYMPLVGAVLVLVVKLLRSGAGALLPWFGTKAGGYFISIATTFGLYIGGTLQAGGSIDYPLIATAAVMTFAAAGGWEAFRDFVMALKGTSNAAKGAATAAFVIVGAISAGGAVSGCATAAKVKTHVNAAGKAIYACSELEKERLVDFTLKLAIDAAMQTMANGRPDWDALEASAWGEATQYGTCAFVSYWDATHPAGASARTLVADPAVEALERLRVKAGGGGWLLANGHEI